MVIKWKKSRAVISVIAFVLGTSLIFSNAVSLGLRISERNGRQELKDAFEKDYQNTSDFRWHMSDYLEDFIVMAVGGPMDGRSHVVYSGTSGDYGWFGRSGWGVNWDDVGHDWGRSATAVQIQPGSGSYENGSDSGGGEPSASDADTGAKREAMAQKVNKEYETDKNVLYSISYDGQLKFTNAEGMNLSGKNETLPEGYNFLLHFDGQKVKIVKDGKELDVYGKGYYDDDSQWYVPGYSNFTVDEKTQKAEIYIAAARVPMIYVKGDYGENGASYRDNRLYRLKKNLEQRKEMYILSGIALLAGIAFFAVYVAFRKEKRRADLFLAKKTEKLWFEWKLLIVIAALGVPLSAAVDFASSDFASSMIYVIGDVGFMVRNFVYLSGGMGYAVMLFWLFYLMVNDFRYNEKTWKHHFCGFALSKMRRSGMKLSIQKRIVRGYELILAAEIAMVCFVALIAVSLGSYIDYAYVSYSASYSAVVILAAALILTVAPCMLYASRNRGVARDLGAIAEQVEAIRGGNLKKPLELPEDTDLLEISENLNDIQRGMKEALEEQTKSERMKVELIANVSHDLKTPLTSIITYAELLKGEEGLPEHVKDYVQILDSKANRLRTMVQDVFEVSKAASGQLPVDLETLDFGKLLRQTLADMGETIRDSAVSLRTDIPEEPVMIVADGKRLYRVFQNLIQNALQYSLDGSRVYISLKADGRVAEASVKNTSQMEINGEVDFTERFVRGDQSRSDSGSGLGLSIAANFTEACGGTLMVEPIADLFVVTVEFEQISRTCRDDEL